MDQLDLLCVLDDHYKLLVDYEEEKKNLSEKYSNDTNINNSIKLEKNINILRENIEVIKEKLYKIEKNLLEYNYTIKDIEDKLYSGKTNDIKQLEILSEEKEDIRDTINNTETKLLQYMEDLEVDEDSLTNMEQELKDILRQNDENDLNYKKIDKELDAKTNKKTIDIDKAKLDIDEELLLKYEKIRKNKKSAIAEIKNEVCLGCNMGISKYMVEKIKISNDIICCENCGRILCKRKV